MIVVGGNDYQILAGFAPSLLLGLMAKDKNINIKKLGHPIEKFLAVPSAPGKKVGRPGLFAVVDLESSIEKLRIKFVSETVAGQ
jgi:hypothetical protein